MEIMLDELNSAVEKAVGKYTNLMEKYEERRWKAYADCNNNLAPNIDRNGRMHAPCDGYEYIEGADHNKTVYNKGEFLPNNERDLIDYFGADQFNLTGRVSKLLITESQKAVFEQLNERFSDYVNVGFSKKCWFDHKLDSNVTYAYLSGYASTYLYNDIINNQLEYLKDKKEEVKNSLPDLEDKDAEQIKGVFASSRYVNGFNDMQTFQLGIKTEQGNMLWGTFSKAMSDAIPSGKDSDFLMGKKVEMTCGIAVNKRNNKEGFYKRPKELKIYDENGVNLVVKKTAARKLKP